MAGYTRQSVSQIINGADITAPPINAEFNQLLAAFNASTGHSHTGVSGSGDSQKIPLATSVAGYLLAANGGSGGKNNFSSSSPTVTNDTSQGYAIGSLWINTTSKRIYICTVNTTNAANWHEMVANTGTVLAPETHNTVDIGTTAVRYKDFFLAGNADVDGTLNVLGTTTTTHIDTGTITSTGLGTFATIDANGGQVDGTVIGGNSASAITGTQITANSGFVGDVTGNVAGNVTSSGTSGFNNITASGTIQGAVTGDVTGNISASSGTSAFNNLTVNGTLDVTGTTIANVTNPVNAQDASTKIYTDTADALKLNLAGGTMSGAIAMGTNKITGLGTPTADTDAATKGFVDTSIANVIDAAPAALDTLNELAAALGDDAAFSTTVTNSIATKLPLAGGTMSGDMALGANKATSTATPATDDTLTRKGYVDTQDALKLNLAGGTMSGAIAMGTSKITGLGDPTSNQDAASKAYTDTADALKLNLAGGTMGGTIAMGTNTISGLPNPSANDHASNKAYVDSILGSSTAAAGSAAAASTSESNASISAGEALTSKNTASDWAIKTNGTVDGTNYSAKYWATQADVATVATNITNINNTAASIANVNLTGGSIAAVNTVAGNLSSISSFANVYRTGSTDPTTSLDEGDLFYNSTSNSLKVYTGSAWESGITAGSGFLAQSSNLSDLADASAARTNLGLGTAATTAASDYATVAAVNAKATKGFAIAAAIVFG